MPGIGVAPRWSSRSDHQASAAAVPGEEARVTAQGGTVAIVGLGLIGGSLARDLAAEGVGVLAHDCDLGAMEEAMRAGVVSAALPDDLAGVEAADALVIALPVDAVAAWLERHAPRISRIPLVMDTGSTKAGIVTAAEGVGIGARFVGAHPLAGDHRSGWEASRAGLFADAPVYLCPTAETGPDALGRARGLWERVGARIVEMDAGEHDRRLAWTSHLPQAVATVLARVLAEAGISPGELGPGGAGMVRLAESSPEMWSGIFEENAAEVGAALTRMEVALGALRDSVVRGDRAAFRKVLAAARNWRIERPSAPVDG
jgi:prephenate dehydrogenase